MLQIKNLSITNRQDLRELVCDFSLNLNDGDKAALIGEEGNGKSTLLQCIYDEKRIEGYADCRGEIIRNGCVLGYIKQELSSAEKEMSVYEFFCEEPAFYNCNGKEPAAMASQLQLPPDILYSQQKMGTLSGGEKVKLQFVRMLCRRPTVLLLDEPSNDIDLQTLAWLEKFICNWKGAVLCISHDETLLERTANRIIHLEMIRKKRKPRHTICNMGYWQYAEERSRSLQKQEQLARKERSEYQSRQEKLRRIEQKVAHQQETITRQDPAGARLLKKKMKAVKSMERRFDKESDMMTEIPDVEEAIFFQFAETDKIPQGKVVLHLEREKLYAGDRCLTKNIQLEIRGPQKVCIIGRNGVGKTTLLKLAAEELLPRKDIRAAYMPQDYRDRMNFADTPLSYLGITGDKEEQTKIRTFLGSLKFTKEEMEHPIGELSGGQKAKLFLLSICVEKANVLILDEPTRNFSPLSNPVIRKMLKEFSGAVISVSHDRKYMAEVCDTIYELSEEGCRRCEWYEK